MSLEQPTDLEFTILEYLATYRFLTVEQLLTLGATKHERHLQATLRSMAGEHRKPRAARVGEGSATRVSARYRPFCSPVVKRLAFGVDKAVSGGRMPFVYTLTPQGAELLSEL